MEDREKNLIRESNLAKWIEKNPADWEKVCGLRYVSIKEMKKLMKSLEENGFKVKLTRNDENTKDYTDTNIYDLNGRITSACKSKAKLMISLHINNGGNELKGFGNLVLIKHSDGWITAYAHNDKLLVHKGQKVQRGVKIATVGSTGSVTTPQLHFEVRAGKKAVNPRSYLP